MVFKVAVVYYSKNGLLVILANIIAEGARKVRFTALVWSTSQSQIMIRGPSSFIPRMLVGPWR